MLSAPELRKLVRAHNELSKIKIPKGATVEDMVKLIESNGYSVNHEKKRLDAKVKRGRQITLKQAEIITAPKKKSELEKVNAKRKKHETIIKYIVANKEILEDERIKSL